MGTNFYLRYESQEYERGIHLGKRSAAGMYCYGCNISLVTGMPGGLNVQNPHMGEGKNYRACPICGARQSGNFYNPELFTPTAEQTDREEKYVVRYSCSFGFAIPPEELSAYTQDVLVVDEYGTVFSMHEFRRDVIEKAAFLFTHHVGQCFS